MVFAMAVLGTYVTYATLTPLLKETGLPFILGLIWGPWLIGAAAITTRIWRLRADVLGLERPLWPGMKLSWLYRLVFLAAFFGLPWLAKDLDPWAHATTAAGLFIIAVAQVHDQVFEGRVTMLPQYMAGLAAIAFGLGLQYLPGEPLQGVLPGLVDGLAVATFYFLAGLYTYHRGQKRPYEDGKSGEPLKKDASST